MEKTVTLKVGMTCGGCKSAVTKLLSKLDGVNDVDANLDTNLVVVKCNETVSNELVLGALQKWSTASKKTVELIL